VVTTAIGLVIGLLLWRPWSTDQRVGEPASPGGASTERKDATGAHGVPTENAVDEAAAAASELASATEEAGAAPAGEQAMTPPDSVRITFVGLPQDAIVKWDEAVVPSDYTAGHN
jgi:hypothetical protein